MAAIKRKHEKPLPKEYKKAKISAEPSAKKSKKFEKLRAENPKVKKPAPPLVVPKEPSSESEDFDELDSTNQKDGGNDGERLDRMNVDGEEKSKLAKTNDDPEKSKKAHAEQKRLVKERKMAKPNADITVRSKKIWEQIRRTGISSMEKKPLIAELQTLTKGHITDLVFKHDLSRVVQTALKYGDKATRAAIAKELKGKYVELAQSGYGKYLVVKVMHYGTAETRSMVTEEFYGHVRKLIRHREASFVIEDCYREYGTPAQKAMLLREFYGIEFALFKDKDDTTMTLKEILKKNPEKRATIMKNLSELIRQCIEKGAVFFTIVHKAMLEYLLNTQPGTTESTEFVELIKEHVSEIAFTKDGAQVVARCLALGGAKDRKVMIKSLKSVVPQLAAHESGYIVLITAYEVVDDTVLVSKAFIPEFEQNFFDLAVSAFARIPLLYPLVGRKPRLLSPSAVPSLQEIDQIRQSTSKKDPSLRLSELRTALSPMLVQGVTAHAGALAQDSFGCQLVTEVLVNTTGVDKSAAVAAIASLASGDPTSDAHIAATASGGRMLKTLVAGGYFNANEKKVEVIDPDLGFHRALYPHIQQHLTSWATGAGSFVIVGLLEAETFDAGDLLKQLLKCQTQIEAAAEGGNKGARVILEKLR